MSRIHKTYSVVVPTTMDKVCNHFPIFENRLVSAMGIRVAHILRHHKLHNLRWELENNFRIKFIEFRWFNDDWFEQMKQIKGNTKVCLQKKISHLFHTQNGTINFIERVYCTARKMMIDYLTASVSSGAWECFVPAYRSLLKSLHVTTDARQSNLT